MKTCGVLRRLVWSFGVLSTLIALHAASCPGLHAQQVAAIPSPQSVLGFTPGDDRRIANWREITNYFAALDRASDSVSSRVIGQSTLQRPLIAVFISSPDNLRDLEKYGAIQRRLADVRTIPDETERDRLIGEGRAVVALSCSIHSTGIVASQMSMQLAYELASGRDANTREILRETILILIPSANPDGIDVVADWYRRTLGTSYEGVPPPEIGHHYAGVDNDRDWFMLNLPETRAITRLFWREWHPAIVYDLQEQSSAAARFFAPPPRDPPNPNVDPLILREVGVAGYKIAAELEASGVRGVITGAGHDVWSHGGFSTAPYYHNSVGLWSAAAGARLMTPVTVTREQLSKKDSRGMLSALQRTINFPAVWPGGLWRSRDIMRMEMIAARAVLTLAARHRQDYLRNFYELGRRAVNYPLALDRPQAYVIPAGQGRDEAVAKMIGALVAQGVEVFRLDRELHAMGVGPPAETMSQKAQEVPAGSYIVFLSQPQRANVQALFETQIYPEWHADERLGDVAGWTLPLQMGVETIPVAVIRELDEQRQLTLINDESEVRRDLGLPRAEAGGGSASRAAKSAGGRPARLAVYRGWTGSGDEGWTRFTLDEFNVPYQSLRDEALRAGNLRARFDAIILPSQSDVEIVEGNRPDQYPAEFAGGITEAGVRHLREFVEDGGTLICFDASTELAIKRFDLPLRNALERLDEAEFYCPGSIVRMDVDSSNALARGVPREVDAFFFNGAAFEVADASRVRVAARFANRDVLRSGWLRGERHVAGKAALVEVTVGRGRIVLFGFRPQHRGQTWATFPFILNAVNSSAAEGAK